MITNSTATATTTGISRSNSNPIPSKVPSLSAVTLYSLSLQTDNSIRSRSLSPSRPMRAANSSAGLTSLTSMCGFELTQADLQTRFLVKNNLPASLIN